MAKKAGWIGREFSQSVTTQKADTKTIVEYINASGKNQPKTEVKISPDVSGEITELYSTEGDRVAAGDPLSTIKPDLYLSALNRADAALNTAKARLSQTEVNENNIVKVSLYDTALVEVDACLHRKFKGVVTDIAYSAKLTWNATDQITDFDVKILLLLESYARLIESTT